MPLKTSMNSDDHGYRIFVDGEICLRTFFSFLFVRIYSSRPLGAVVARVG